MVTRPAGTADACEADHAPDATPKITSSGVFSSSVVTLQLANSTLRCDSIAPLGSPVLPDV